MVTSNQVFQWPEFQALAKRLGINLDSPCQEFTLHLDLQNQKPPIITMTCVGGRPKPSTPAQAPAHTVRQQGVPRRVTKEDLDKLCGPKTLYDMTRKLVSIEQEK